MNRALVLGLVFLYSFFTFSGIASPETDVVEAAQNPFVCTGTLATCYGFAGLNANFTNELQTNMTVDVFFAWYNAVDQAVNIGEQFNATFAAGQTVSFFNAHAEPGVSNVVAFVRDLRGNTLSLECSGQVTIP